MTVSSTVATVGVLLLVQNLQWMSGRWYSATAGKVLTSLLATKLTTLTCQKDERCQPSVSIHNGESVVQKLWTSSLNDACVCSKGKQGKKLFNEIQKKKAITSKFKKTHKIYIRSLNARYCLNIALQWKCRRIIHAEEKLTFAESAEGPPS